MMRVQRMWVLAGMCLLLTGLLGGLLIAWMVSDKQAPGADQTSAESFKTIVAAGDISCNTDMPVTDFTCRSKDTAALVSSIDPDAVLTTGDNQYPIGTLDSFQNAYDKTWGAFKNKTYPTPGNHDYYTAGAAGYYDYFGPRAGERGKGYYSFTIGEWRLFALNSEIDVSATSEQVTWLRNELKNTTNACTLAYWHKPRFSSGGHPSDPAFDAVWRILYDNNVDIVVNGHSHGYERFVAQNPDGQPDPARGITQFVSGMGGYNPEELREPLPTLVTRQNHSFGVLALDLYADRAVFAFMPIDASQTFTDKGTVYCH